VESFDELTLSAPIQRAIKELGYEKPSPIQVETLPILLGEPTDFLGLAATGTGKTAAFGIPMLEQLDPQLRTVQALILCPTRELALQVAGQIDLLGKYKGIRALPVYGGSPYYEQIQGLRSGAKVVVGTPGRVVDHLEKGTLRLEDLQVLILDEADEMISMGFKDELEKILSKAPRDAKVVKAKVKATKNEDELDEAFEDSDDEEAAAVVEKNCKIWLFSATMSAEVRKVANKYLRDAKHVQVNRKEMLPTSVEQLYYLTHEGNKPEVLCKLIEAAENFYGLVFCQTKSLVQDLTSYLIERGYKVDCLHGDKDQNARERTMNAFREKKVTLLVCTDVASRGLDVKDITHVINYSIPRELDSYVHRIGRTARSGKAGIAMSLVTPSHRRLIFQIEQMTKTRMLEGRIPTRKEVGTKKVAKILPKFQDQPFHARAVEVMDESWKTAVAGMTAEEVAGRFLSMMMPEVFSEKEQTQQAPPARRPSPSMGDSRGGDQRPQRSYGSNGPSNGPSYGASSNGPARRPTPSRQYEERPDRPPGARQDGRPEFRPERRPEARPAPRAEMQTDRRPAARPYFNADDQQDTQPAARTEMRTDGPKKRFPYSKSAGGKPAPVRPARPLGGNRPPARKTSLPADRKLS
jgi:ATP-dependent RNA helicase DeaD